MKNFISGMLVMAVIGFSTISFAAIGDKVEAIFAEYNIFVDGEEQIIEAIPVVINDSTYVPLRAMANMLGKDVTYKSDSRTIELNTPIVAKNGKEVKSHVTDFSGQTPEEIASQIRGLKNELDKDNLDEDMISRVQKAIADRQFYLESLGDYEQIIEINKQIIEIDKEINGIKTLIEFQKKALEKVDPIESERHYATIQDSITKAEAELAELEAQRAQLESQ